MDYIVPVALAVVGVATPAAIIAWLIGRRQERERLARIDRLLAVGWRFSERGGWPPVPYPWPPPPPYTKEQEAAFREAWGGPGWAGHP